MWVEIIWISKGTSCGLLQQGNKHSDSIKGRVFLDWLSDGYLLKEFNFT